MEEFQIDFVADDKDVVQQISFKGELLLGNQSRVKETLSVLDLSSCNKLEIQLSEVSDLDLAFLQVLYSFLSNLKKLKIKYSITWPDDTELVGLIDRSGLANNFN
ncbi:hypothetical protein ACUNWD_18150 [Sunxiuqinia sp. A32]|uniref:hypothetical protein n=1 Tax=Sunxiuqinia sp. A32 TaxID=3461496 RepID=UPI004045D750